MPTSLHNFSDKPIVLIGLMGAGKSSIGRKLASKLVLPFWDSDDEIATTSNCSIPEIFAIYGEARFRALEEIVIERLLSGPQHVLATGGGAFMNKKIQGLIKKKAISIWLKAGLETLIKRTSRKKGRPLLDKGDPTLILKDLMDKRYPIYSSADIIVESADQPHENMVNQIITAYSKLIG